MLFITSTAMHDSQCFLSLVPLCMTRYAFSITSIYMHDSQCFFGRSLFRFDCTQYARFFQPTKCWYCVNYGRRDTEKGLAFEPNQYKRLRGQKWMEKKISIPMWFRMKISRIKRPECTCNESADRSV